MKKDNIKEVNMYKVRKEFCEGNEVHCLAFTAPLLTVGSGQDSDNEDYGELNQFPSIVNAKKKWKKVYQIVMDKDKKIPLKQMAWKAKHEDKIFQQIFESFTYGRSISHLRRRLANLNENMKFEGGPKDKAYKKKIQSMMTNRVKRHSGRRDPLGELQKKKLL